MLSVTQLNITPSRNSDAAIPRDAAEHFGRLIRHKVQNPAMQLAKIDIRSVTWLSYRLFGRSLHHIARVDVQGIF
jgi:hypothetical protein